MTETPSLTFRTNFTPPVTINPLSKVDVKPGFDLLSILQPSVDGNLPIIGRVHYAPKGEPSGYGLAIASVTFALAIYGLFHLLTSK